MFRYYDTPLQTERYRVGNLCSADHCPIVRLDVVREVPRIIKLSDQQHHAGTVTQKVAMFLRSIGLGGQPMVNMTKGI